MTVRELIKELSCRNQDATVLLFSGTLDAQAASNDTCGIPPGETLGANCVFTYDGANVYIVHSSDPAYAGMFDVNKE